MDQSRMRQEFLMLAEGAEAVNGKMYLLGGGADVHMSPSFPVALKADVALSFLVEWAETNRPIDLQVRIVDEDEKEVVLIGAEVVVGRPPQARPGQALRSMVSIRGPFPVEKPGAYKLSMRLDGIDQEPPFRFWLDRAPIPTVG